VYFSTLIDLSLETEIVNILETSIKNNKADGITGMLLYCQGNFMQVLEGDEEAVQRTYDRISKDSRHHNIIEVIREPIQEREFADWSMGFSRLQEEDLQAFPAYATLFDFHARRDAIAGHPGIALDLLRQFSTNIR
jgi:hypothetical protein